MYKRVKKKKILAVGSRPPPINGQSVSFQSAIQGLHNENNIIKEISSSFKGETSSKTISLVSNYIYQVMKSRLTFKPNVIYFLCSRTLIGSLRDLFLLAVYYFSNVKIVNHLHGSDYRSFLENVPFLYKKLIIFLFKRVDKHIVLIEGMNEQFFDITQSPKKIITIQNFYGSIVDTTNIFIQKKSFNPEKINLIYLSGICKSKGIFDVISASERLSEKGILNRLIIAGEGMDDIFMDKGQVMEKLLLAIDKHEFIKYVGLACDSQKYNLLAKAHIFILPSYYESEAVPLSIIEAMRMGCIVITTNYRYLPKLVENKKNGFLVEPRSPFSISDRVEYLYRNRDMFNKISSYNMKQAKELYSESTYQSNIVKYIG